MSELADHLLDRCVARAAALTPVEAPRLHSRLWRELQPAGDSALRRSLGADPHRDDDALFRAWQAGEREAFDLLLERHLGRLVAYARRYLPAADADDAVFAALSELSAKLGDLPPERSALQQLFGFVRISALRAERERLRHAPAGDVDPDTLPAGEETVLEQVARGFELARLAEALEAACTPLEQAVIVETQAGLAPRDIAAKLSLTPNHVRVVKHRALTKLRASLGEAS